MNLRKPVWNHLLPASVVHPNHIHAWKTVHRIAGLAIFLLLKKTAVQPGIFLSACGKDVDPFDVIQYEPAQPCAFMSMCLSALLSPVEPVKWHIMQGRSDDSRFFARQAVA